MLRVCARAAASDEMSGHIVSECDNISGGNLLAWQCEPSPARLGAWVDGCARSRSTLASLGVGCVCTQPTTAFKPKTLYNLIFTSMAVVTVPVPSDDDILGWTRESLEGSPVAARLRPLFEALNLQHLDRNDAARGARQGLGYARADFVSALLAHQAARLAALGGLTTGIRPYARCHAAKIRPNGIGLVMHANVGYTQFHLQYM